MENLFDIGYEDAPPVMKNKQGKQSPPACTTTGRTGDSWCDFAQEGGG